MEQTVARLHEQAYQAMRDRVATFKDALGMPIDAGIFETVVVLNLLGLQTFQSCEGHLDHGCPYPWITIKDPERDHEFNRLWLHVCELEEQAKATETVAAYDTYLAKDIQLRALIAQWEREDVILEQITTLLDTFYAEEPEQDHAARLLAKRLQPGTYRLEPGFSIAVKKLSVESKSLYLARGQAEMQAFTSYLMRLYVLR